jgi:hypothetical protein
MPTNVLPADPDVLHALEALAATLEARILTAPERAQAVSYRSPHESHQKLAETRQLRPLLLAAQGLVAAHQQHAVPPLLGRVRTRQHLATLLRLGLEPTLSPAGKKALAGAAIPDAVAQEAARQLWALLPDPLSAGELRFALWLERAGLRVSALPEAGEAPVAILDRLLAVADLQPGLGTLLPLAGAGYVAERLAEQYPAVRVRLTEPQERLQDCLRLLAARYPQVVLEGEEPTGPAERVVLFPATRWRIERADVPLVVRAYHRWLSPGGRLTALLRAFSGEDRALTELERWVRNEGGSVEALEGEQRWRDQYRLVSLVKRTAQGTLAL